MKFTSCGTDYEASYTLDEGNEDEDKSNYEALDKEIQNIIGKKRKGQEVKKRPGKKGMWPESLLTDMVDIIVTNDHCDKGFSAAGYICDLLNT